MASMVRSNDNVHPVLPKRRWFRFSLRTFLLVITALALWLGWKFGEAREQRRVVAELIGLDVQYDFSDYFGGSPPEPAWLIDLVGVDFFHDVVGVRFNANLYIDPHELTRRSIPSLLARLPRLQSIELVVVQLDDEDLRRLAPLKRLKSVDFLS